MRALYSRTDSSKYNNSFVLKSLRAVKFVWELLKTSTEIMIN